jgi:predicted acylesterase/phospholipase RssA
VSSPLVLQAKREELRDAGGPTTELHIAAAVEHEKEARDTGSSRNSGSCRRGRARCVSGRRRTRAARRGRLPLTRIFGISVGALNATLFAQGELLRLWQTIREEDVHRTFSWPRVAWRVTVGGQLGFNDNRPLRDLIREHGEVRPFLVPAHAGRVSLVTGLYDTVESSELGFFGAVWQSATMLAIWEPVGERAYVDGAIGNAAPLGDALDHEPSEIVVVLNAPKQSSRRNRRATSLPQPGAASRRSPSTRSSRRTCGSFCGSTPSSVRRPKPALPCGARRTAVRTASARSAWSCPLSRSATPSISRPRSWPGTCRPGSRQRARRYGLKIRESFW